MSVGDNNVAGKMKNTLYLRCSSKMHRISSHFDYVVASKKQPTEPVNKIPNLLLNERQLHFSITSAMVK